MATAFVEEVCLDESLPASENGTAKRANLGLSLILSAISDYRTAPEASRAFKSARAFLYHDRADKEARDHFEWVLAMARGLDADWLRERLDRARPQWDAERTSAWRRKAA